MRSIFVVLIGIEEYSIVTYLLSEKDDGNSDCCTRRSSHNNYTIERTDNVDNRLLAHSHKLKRYTSGKCVFFFTIVTSVCITSQIEHHSSISSLHITMTWTDIYHSLLISSFTFTFARGAGFDG